MCVLGNRFVLEFSYQYGNSLQVVDKIREVSTLNQTVSRQLKSISYYKFVNFDIF